MTAHDPVTHFADVVVVGYGGAGAAAALEADAADADVIVLEKSSQGGGHTRESGGSLRQIVDVDAAATQLAAHEDGPVPPHVYRTFAEGVAPTLTWLEELGAKLEHPPSWFEGFPRPKALAQASIRDAGGLGGRLRVASPGADDVSGGEALWEVLDAAVRQRPITVHHGVRGVCLIRDPGTRRVAGVRARVEGRSVVYRSRTGVVLTTGGFAADSWLQHQYYGTQLAPMGLADGNTGDGIRMAQQAGADLWHMTAFASVLGYVIPEVGRALHHRMPRAGFCYVDRRAQRFIDETGLDFHALPEHLLAFDHESADHPWMPAFVIFDEATRLAGPIVNPTLRASRKAGWSSDNGVEVDRGWIASGETVEQLAVGLGLDPATLAATVGVYNAACAAGRDESFGRAAEDLVPVSEPPFYGIAVWPVLVNTQGGPRRDERARVLDPFGDPIPGLFAAGELGSIWGRLYPGAGNVTEALVFGRIAGREAATCKERS